MTICVHCGKKLMKARFDTGSYIWVHCHNLNWHCGVLPYEQLFNKDNVAVPVHGESEHGARSDSVDVHQREDSSPKKSMMASEERQDEKLATSNSIGFEEREESIKDGSTPSIPKFSSCPKCQKLTDFAEYWGYRELNDEYATHTMELHAEIERLRAKIEEKDAVWHERIQKTIKYFKEYSIISDATKRFLIHLQKELLGK